MQWLCLQVTCTVNGIPIVCSGIVGTATDSCYVYSKEGEKWVKYIQTISNKVYHASSISLTNALFVTGGYEPISKLNVNTTSLVFTNGTIKNGPNMPEGLRRHCMASMYDGKVAAIIGGKYLSKVILCLKLNWSLRKVIENWKQ